MKKSGIINSELSWFIASLGHTDKFIICDGGFPIPSTVPIIDLALCCGVPTFEQVLDAILNEVQIEYYCLSEEIEEKNKKILEHIKNSLPETEHKLIKHIDLKELSKEVKFAVRTGEFTPYANIILISGVAFDV